jgi:hypothetical protein
MDVVLACQSFCPKIVTVFMSAFKSTDQVRSEVIFLLQVSGIKQ